MQVDSPLLWLPRGGAVLNTSNDGVDSVFPPPSPPVRRFHLLLRGSRKNRHHTSQEREERERIGGRDTLRMLNPRGGARLPERPVRARGSTADTLLFHRRLRNARPLANDTVKAGEGRRAEDCAVSGLREEVVT